MRVSNNISITGFPGAGKSTITKLLVEKTGYDYFTVGSIARGIAESMGITLSELGILSKSDTSYDKLYDQKQCEFLAENPNNFIFDSRLGFFFAPNSFKIYLTIDPLISAERTLIAIQNDPSRASEKEAGQNVSPHYPTISPRGIVLN